MTPERVITLRAVQGINRIEDARITDAGSWFTTKNLFGRNPGVLAKRPGSKLVAAGSAGTIDPPTGRVNNKLGEPGGTPNIPESKLGPGESISVIKYEFFNNIHDALGSLAILGLGGIRPLSIAALRTSAMPFSSPITLAPQAVSVLHRLYLDKGTKRYWVGAYNFASDIGDKLFWIKNETTTPTAQILNTIDGLLTSSGGLFRIIPYYYNDDPNSPAKSYFAIGTNGLNQPFVLKDASSWQTNAEPIQATALDVIPSDLGAVSDGDPRMVSVNDLTVYNGSVVWGGYKTLTKDTGTKEHFDNYIAFSNPGEPHKLVQTGGVVSNVRIGDTPAEAVTAVAINSISTDTVGIKGQLVVFTEKRVVIFDGMPPTDGNPHGVNFQSIAVKDIGCNAPKTVVQTPKGLMFLGSDGIVYLIRAFDVSGPTPVGRAVEPMLKFMTPRQQRSCAAVYDQGFYKLSYVEAEESTTAGVDKAIGSGAAGTASAHRNMHGDRPDNTIPSLQLWADIRYLSQDLDLGVRWFGPMTGMWHQCFAVALGAEDRGQIFAGSALNGDVFEISREDIMSDPKTSQSPTAAADPVPIQVEALTGVFDLGDAHVDKTVSAISIGVATNTPVTITTRAIVTGEVSGQEVGQSFTRAVGVLGTTLGGIVLGTSTLISPETFTLVTERPGKRLRGRTFQFRFTESGSAKARMHFSDLSFRATIAKRRV